MWMQQGGKRMVGGRDGRGMWGCHELLGGGCGREWAVAGAKAGKRGSRVGDGSQKVGEGEQCPPRTGLLERGRDLASEEGSL